MNGERRARIAVIDDDRYLRQSLDALLTENGFDAVLLAGSQDYFNLSPEQKVDLALIDLKLRGESGHTLALQIRTQTDLPIVMLTGTGDEVDKIIGLETGADDYIMKPFNPRELIARIRAVLRRYGKFQAPVNMSISTDHDTIRFDDKILDRTKRELLRLSGEEIPLTNAEYRLLEFFACNPNKIITRPNLLAELGSDLSQYVDRTIDVLILRLRRKIENVPSKPIHLQTRRGQGYIFVLEDRP